MAWQPSPEAMKVLTRLNATWRTQQSNTAVKMQLFEIGTDDPIGEIHTMPPGTTETACLDALCALNVNTPARKQARVIIGEQEEEINRLKALLAKVQATATLPPEIAAEVSAPAPVIQRTIPANAPDQPVTTKPRGAVIKPEVIEKINPSVIGGDDKSDATGD